MADISVTLVLDDSQYTGKLKAAGVLAEDVGKKIAAANASGVAGFDKLNNSVGTFTSKLGGLATVIAGAGFAALTRSALDLADSIQDLSIGADISIEKIINLREAFQANGGSAEGLGKIIQKLNNYLQDARDGSSQAQESLMRLGLSLKDMANMDTEQALAKTIDSLAKMTDATERNALAARIFGKEAKNINWEGIKAGTTTVTEEQKKYSKAVEEAGAAHDRLEAAGERMLLAFDKFLSDSGILGLIDAVTKHMWLFETAIGAAGLLFTAYFGLKAVETVRDLAKEMRSLAVAVGMVEGAAAGGAAGGGWALIKKLLSSPKFLAGATGLAMLLTPSELGNGELTDAEKKLTQKGGGGTPDKPALAPAWQGKLTEINQLSDAYDKLTQKQREQYGVDTMLMGMNQDDIADIKLMAGITDEYTAKVDELTKARDKLAATKNEGNKNEINAEVAAYNKELAELEKIYKKTYDIADLEKDARQKKRQEIAEFELATTRRLTLEKEMQSIVNQAALIGLNEREKAMKQIEQQQMAIARAEIEAENKKRGLPGGMNGRSPLTAAEEQKYFDAAKARTIELQQAQGLSIDKSREFATGWHDAYNQYIDDATNAANQAKQIFAAMTGAMDNAIDTFVKTGKFSFKDFAVSIIQDLEKIMIKAAMINLIKSSGLGDMFAGLFADGGTIPSGQFGIVGEAGPEFVKGPATVTSARDTANMMGGQASNQYITNNISAIDSRSVAQLFAENRQILFGNVEQARKEMPMRTR